ncbi:MAG: hypothetical protein WC310_00130 [Patescibacteria group bacterium]|jgi:hypothetical protein
MKLWSKKKGESKLSSKSKNIFGRAISTVGKFLAMRSKIFWMVSVAAVVFTFGIVAPIVDEFVVVQKLTDSVKAEKFFAAPKGYEGVKGTIFVAVMMNLYDVEFDRPLGGYRPDNLIWFAWPYDKVCNFQLGVMQVLQRTAIEIKDRTSRSGGGADRFDRRAAKMSAKWNMDLDDWFLTAWKLDSGRDLLDDYLEQLKATKAVKEKTGKYPADGSVFLTNSVTLDGLLEVWYTLLGDVHKDLSDPDMVSTEVDDVYFRALGVVYAVGALARAAHVEFANTLGTKEGETYYAELEMNFRNAMAKPIPIWTFDGKGTLSNDRSKLETDVNAIRMNIGSIRNQLAK